MITPATYAPEVGSVPWTVVQFLQSNPDEQLDADNIAAKCDCSRASVHTLLRPAVDAQLLKRDEDAPSGELVYSLGQAGAAAAMQQNAGGFHAWLERKGQDSAQGKRGRRRGTAAPAPAAPAAAPVETPAAQPPKRSRPYWVDVNTVTIEQGVPMSGRSRGLNWVPLLDKLAVGDSFSQPKAARSSLTTAMKAYKEASGKVLRSEVDAQSIRVWRVS